MARRDQRKARKARRQTRRSGQREWERYKMTQKIVSIGDDYSVENDAGERVFDIDGKALRLRDTLKMRDCTTGDEYTIQERVVRIKDTMTINKNGQKAAVVKKDILSPIRDRFTISIPDGSDLQVKGNLLDHEYKILRDGDRVAEVSKKWFRIRDTYGVEVAPEMDAGLVVASTVALDMLVHPTR